MKTLLLSLMLMSPAICFAGIAASDTKCLISIEGEPQSLIIDAKEIKSISLYKVNENPKGFQNFLSFGTYPLISLIAEKGGVKKVFFQENSKAQSSYDKALAALKICKSVKVQS